MKKQIDNLQESKKTKVEEIKSVEEIKRSFNKS
jgi:hypothetical protein